MALCYWLLPRGLAVILGFTPDDVTNIIGFKEYFHFVVRLELVFGVAFLLPVFVIMLNLVGVFAGRTLSRGRPWVIFGIFAFAAIATPTGDPITMLSLAIPMWILFEIAVVVCRFNDKRHARALAEIEQSRQALRYVHLAAHLTTPPLLTQAQVRRYNELRGYGQDPCSDVPAGHDPVMWRQHNGCN